MIKSFFQKLLPGRRRQGHYYAKLLDGSLPIFSSFGRDIYASDVIQAAINRIATEMSKVEPRHVRVDENGSSTQPKGDFNRLFKFGPNPIMTTSEFMEKVTWLLYMNYNCFVYPAYEVVIDNRGRAYRRHTGFYPLEPTTVEFLQDNTGKLFAKFSFGGGENFTLPYDEVIHLRKKFSANSLLGGGANGRPDNDSLIRVLKVEHTVLEGLEKAIPASLNIRGILKVNTLLDDKKQEEERKRFEKALQENRSGILPMDLKGEYFPLQVDPKLVDKDTLAFLQDKILNWVEVPLKILNGTFAGDEYQIWYEQVLSPLMIRMGQSFSRVLFTENELNHGNEMVFYQRDHLYMSMESKLKMIDVLGQQGLLEDDQKLAIIGYPPIKDGAGNRRTQSLNFISVEIADEYQSRRAGFMKDDFPQEDEEPEE